MRRRAVVALALGMAGMGPGLALALPGPGQGQEVRRRLRFHLTFSNPHAYDLQDQVFACYLPASLGSGQRLHKVEASMQHRVETDGLGHRIVLLTFGQFPRFGQRTVTLNAEVHMDGGAVHGALDDVQQWLRSERFIESDAEPIRTLAASLRGRGEHDTVVRIYDWVRANMNYAGFVAQDRGALDALTRRLGDCTEYATLVVALARACALPARMVGGHVVDRDMAPPAQDYHNWAEVYLDGAWRTVDAQKQSLFSSASQYIVFRIYRDAATNSVGLAHRYRMQGPLEVRM